MNLEVREKRALKNAYKRFLPILLIAIIVFSVLVSYIHFLNERKIVFDTQHKLISDAAINYNNYISNLTSIVRSIEVGYIELIAGGYSDAEINALFIKEMKSNPTIDQLRILDVDGREIIRINKGHPAPYVVPENELQDKSSRYYYTETKLLGRNQFLFSALDLNIENNEIEIDPDTGLAKPTFRISTPIVVDEIRIGYFVVNFLMRNYLSELRKSSNITGGNTILFDKNGYMLNHENEKYNFGFSYEPKSEESTKTIKSVFPKINLESDSGSFIQNYRICSYTAYSNITNLSKDYFLSENATDKIYFMVYFDKQSEYGNYARYEFFDNIMKSWEAQLVMLLIITVFYFAFIFLYFLINRFRFTNGFSDNRYKKSRLKKAIHNHEFVNYYQPIINIQDGTILGFEALARWKHQNEVLPPSKFMEEIENYELYLELDENTYINTQSDRKKLEDLGITDYTFISININRQTFECMIKENSSTIIKLNSPEKEYMVIELLEDIVIHKKAANKIREMDSENVHFAIDDFGTGNSNVAFIRSFKNMNIKIDKAFVPNDVNNKKECVIIEAFVKMFVDQGLKLIVEGVETREQYLYLKNLNVAGVQGFYFSKPLPLEQLIDFMKNKKYLDKM
jgi:EAL domain-containing protein (putative c-di-GMP-specific phosphodiesterase class I)